MQNQPRNNTVLYILGLVAATVIALAAIMYYSGERRSATLGDKVEAAAGDVADGIDNATEDMQNRTPAEKAGDAIEDAGDRVQRSLD